MRFVVSLIAVVSLFAVLARGQGSSTQSSQTSETKQTSQSGTGKATASTSSSASSSASGGQRGWGGGSTSANAQSMEKPTHALFFRYNEDSSVNRERALRAHNEYLTGLAKQGVVLLSGPWRDEPGEMTLVRVRTDEQAQSVIAEDPAVKAGLLIGEAKAWTVNISVSGVRPADRN